MAISLIGEGSEGNNNWSSRRGLRPGLPERHRRAGRRGDYEHSATLRFVTNEQTQRMIRYGTNSGVYPNAVSDTTPRFSHIVTITGLAAERVYHYAIVITDTGAGTLAAPLTICSRPRPPAAMRRDCPT